METVRVLNLGEERIALELFRSNEERRIDKMMIETDASPALQRLFGKEVARQYALGRFVLLRPSYTFTVLLDRFNVMNEVGRLINCKQDGEERIYIGKAQSWYYPQTGDLVIWECYAHKNVMENYNLNLTLKRLWEVWEEECLRIWPQTQRIITPSWEPTVEIETYREFLKELGYRAASERVWSKCTTDYMEQA